MFTVYFSVVYPALNYIKTGSFFEKAILKVFQAKIFWDTVSFLLFVVLSCFLMSLSSLTKALVKKITKKQATLLFIPLIGFLWTIYIGLGL